MQLFTAVLLHIEQNIYFFFNTDTIASFNVRFISAVSDCKVSINRGRVGADGILYVGHAKCQCF